MNSRPWLANVPWELVVWQNAQLCNFKKLITALPRMATRPANNSGNHLIKA